MRVVVCDTGPVLHLREAEALQLLAAAGEIFVPPAVERGLEARLPDWPTIRPSWLQVARAADQDTRQIEELMAIGGRP